MRTSSPRQPRPETRRRTRPAAWVARLAPALVALLFASPSAGGELAPGLRERLLHADEAERVPVVVLMEAFPGQGALLADVRGMNSGRRRAHVVRAMQDLAERSQRGVRAALAASAGDAARVRVLWGINGVALAASPRLIERIAARADVRWVLHDREIPQEQAIGVDPERVLAERPPWPGLNEGPFPRHDGGGDGPTGGDASGPNPAATVAGEVVAMEADRVWNELGYTGNGVIVGVIDSGIDRDHPDLADHIWTNLDEVDGNLLDDDGNGYVDDTWGWDFCSDDNSPDGGTHGTQVAGQVAGDGTNGTVTGMAPDAELMSLRIACGGPSAWWAASDYAIANGAHVITQSYSSPWNSDPDYEAFRRQTDTELAAGVIHLNSSGNTGQSAGSSLPIPYNVNAPALSPPPWLHPDQGVIGSLSSVVAIANINWSSDTIDVTSPYGPSAWEDIQANTDATFPHVLPPEYLDYPHENGGQQGLLKPDLAAYGQNTSTTCPGTGYCGFGGTSSATPHVAGVAALMLSSNPQATPEFLAEALLTTAEPRGVAGKNNRYGTGLVQAYDAVVAVESTIRYHSHAIEDVAGGNGNLLVDPGERIVMPLTIENADATTTVFGVEAMLSSATPGVTVHDAYLSFASVAPGSTATSPGPHFSFSVDPGTCGDEIEFDIELRFDGKIRSTVVRQRIGDEQAGDLVNDDFEAPGSWTSDPGTTTRGAFVREDPIGVLDVSGTLANPEDDTSDPGVACWVTGNGELNGKKDENNNDVDDGAATLLSPPFGAENLLVANLSYDRWYYDNSSGGDSFRAEVSNDGGQNWVLIEQFVNSTGGWGSNFVSLVALVPLTNDMRVRFVVNDGLEDTAVEGAVDEVRISGRWVECSDFTPSAAQPPNPVGATLMASADPSGHVRLAWSAPPVDGTHDAATLYRVERSTTPDGTFVEVGSATSTEWYDIDALLTGDSLFYRVRAENAGGSE